MLKGQGMLLGAVQWLGWLMAVREVGVMGH